MEFEAISLPIPPNDFGLLQQLVRTWNPFLTTGLDAEDPYSLFDHVLAGNDSDFEIRAVFDRNLISCVNRLARGLPMPSNPTSAETYRVAAGCMAYFIFGRALVDPSPAIHEFADARGSDEANREVRAFRVADHLDPRAYVAIALGRSDRIAPDTLNIAHDLVNEKWKVEPAYDFSKPLKDLSKHRASLTKIALLEREPGRRRDKVQKYLQWCYEDAFFTAPAYPFALIYFGERRQKGMLKGINSSSLSSCLRGIRNAAWDLVYLSYWARNAKIDNPTTAWLFCSRDVALLEIARSLAAPRDPEKRIAVHREVLERNWPGADGRYLESCYQNLWREIEADRERRDADLGARPPAAILLEPLEAALAPFFPEA